MSVFHKAGEGRSYPYYVPFLAIFTMLYLVVELSFNARLLDVTGGDATLEQIDSIEKWGRIISGVALTLALWGWVIYPLASPPLGSSRLGWSTGGRRLALVLTACVCIPLTYHYERKLIDHFVDGSSGAERRTATHLRVLSSAILNGTVNIDGIDLSPGTLQTPQGKAFLAVFPLFALPTIDHNDQSTSILRDVVRETVISKVGTASQHYNKVFVPSVKALGDSYNGYVDGMQAYRRALESIPHQQLSAWNDYVDRLAARHRTPNLIPRYRWADVASDVRDKGVPVPENWAPTDRAGFYAAVSMRVHREARENFDKETSRNVGAILPFNLSWQDFTHHWAVQRKWHREIHAPMDAALDPQMGLAAYAQAVWEPAVNDQVSQKISLLMMDTQSFEDGGAHAEDGRSAMEALIAPPIALAFSLLGALTHIYKVLKFTTWWAFPSWRGRSYYVLAFIYGVALLFFFLPNSVSDAHAFAILAEHTRQGAGLYGWLVSKGILWTVQAQPYFYPLNEFVRHFLLCGYDFGARLQP